MLAGDSSRMPTLRNYSVRVLLDRAAHVDESTWQQRLGGRWAISWQAYGIGVALNAPLLILTGGSIGAEPVDVDQMPGWLVVAVVASGLTALWVVIGDRILFPHRSLRPVPVAAVVAYHAVTGLIFTSAIWFVGPRVGVRPDGTFAELAVPTVAIGLWFGLTMVLLLDARDRFGRRREQLMDAAVRAELVILQEDEATTRVQGLIREQVGSVTGALRSEVGATLDSLVPGGPPSLSTTDWHELAERVRASAESSLRPLSHALWQAAEAQFPRPGWAEVVRQWLATGSFSAASSATIVLIGYLRGAVYGIGVIPGTLATIGLAMAVGIVLRSAQAVMAGRPRTRILTGITAFLVAQALGLAFALGMSPAGSPAEAVGSVLAMTISVMAPSIVASLNLARGDLIERLRLTRDTARARQIAQARQLAQVTQHAARVIHGTLQTKLIAAAAAIDEAARTQDADLLAESLGHVSILLDGAADDVGAQADRTVGDEVARASGAWSGILDVEVELDDSVLGITGEAARSVGLIVEEALANAYRHGQAEVVTVSVVASTDDEGRGLLDVTVRDDGTGGSHGTGGLGTMLISGLAQGRVSFESLPEGFLVRARVLREGP